MQEVHYDGTESEIMPLTEGQELEEIVETLRKATVKAVRIFQGHNLAFVANRATKRKPLTRSEKKRRRKEVKASRRRNRGKR
jgi:hypothetical protein